MSKRKHHALLENILVTDYAAEGKSLARTEGKVIFVEHAVPGDLVDIQITKSKKDWAEGRITRIHSYSKDRVEPFCAHFGICGGCQWQMLPYHQQLIYKQKQVSDNLSRIGKIALPEIQPIIGAASDRRYRNKMEYTFSNRRYLAASELHDPTVTSISNVAGFHAKGIFDKIIDIGTCHLQDEPTNLIRHAIKNWALQNEGTFYDIKSHEGWLRTMQVRLCNTGEIMVNIVFGFLDDLKMKALLNHVIGAFPSISTLLYTINSKWNDSLNDLSPQVYYGKGYVIEKLEDFEFKIGPKSFFQTNTVQGERLYQATREFAELTGKQTVYDLYCGTGSIGIFLSKGAAKLIGVEVIAEAVEDARENCIHNAITHAEFFTGDATKICDNSFFEKHGKPDVIITDPPRAGMHDALVARIAEIKAPIVVYVSCNPATQARDLNLLDENYEVTKIQPVDMFPHTHHIENVVQLKLR